MSRKAFNKARVVCGVASLICLFVASGLSGLFHCKSDDDSCEMTQFGTGIYVLLSWCGCIGALGVLYVIRGWLNRKAQKNDNDGRKLRAFFYRLALELMYVGTTTVMPVASVQLLDKFPTRKNVASCALVMFTVLFISYAFLEYEDFGLRDAIEAIFMSILYLTTEYIEEHRIAYMFIAAAIVNVGRLAIFLSNERIKWNQREVVDAPRHETILLALARRLNVIGVGEPVVIQLNDLQAEVHGLLG